MKPQPVTRVFTPPYALRLAGGLRANAFELPIERLERAVNVRLALKDDLELGGAYYSYEPYPPPDSGVAGVRLHVNDIPGLGLTDAARPDLLFLLSIDTYSSNLLDLGRLDGQLRLAYGDLYAVAEYSMTSAAALGDPSVSPQVHWVTFEASPPGLEIALGDTPALDCIVEFELDEADPAAVLERLAGVGGAAKAMRAVKTNRAGVRPRFSLQFETPSLLELGRCALEVDSAAGGAVKVSRYRVSGDLLRDGSLMRIENSF